MTTQGTMTRCLAHGCAKPDECQRHLAIRQPSPPPDDDAVVENACAVMPGAFIPIAEAEKK